MLDESQRPRRSLSCLHKLLQGILMPSVTLPYVQVGHRSPLRSSLALVVPQIMWMKANHARNLRFLGRIDEAIPLYAQLSHEIFTIADMADALLLTCREKWVADDVNSTPHQYMPDDIYQRIMAPGDDPLNHPILNLIPYIRGTRVLHIKLNQGYPLRPYDVATGETVYLTRGQARDLLSAKKNFCDNNPKLDLEMTLHTQGEMKGKTETRGTPKLRHDPPVKNVVCVRYLPNGQPYTWELPLPGDPFEIDQEEVKECWLTRCGKTKDLKLCVSRPFASTSQHFCELTSSLVLRLADKVLHRAVLQSRASGQGLEASQGQLQGYLPCGYDG